MQRARWCVAALLLAAGCTCGTPVVGICKDADGDGADSCADCDDANPSTGPGAAEACDGQDNDCDRTVDEDCECVVGSAPRPCGPAGSACAQACSADGRLEACVPVDGGPMTADPFNCGSCGNVCLVPLNATARCVEARCTRGPCAPGFFDVDGTTTFGCESRCASGVCTGPDGGATPIDSEPLPETGVVFFTFASGSSEGSEVQTNASFTNMGTLGEPSPPYSDGSVESSNASFRNVGGFNSIHRKQ